MIMMPTAMEALSALKICDVPNSGLTISGETKVRAKNPSTTVGIPARTSSTGLTALRSQEGAYSLRKIAVMSPTGMAKSAANAATNRVPARSGRIPKCAGLKAGVHLVSVKYSQMDTTRKNPTVSSRRVAIIPNVVSIDANAQRNRRGWITASLARRTRASRGRLGLIREAWPAA